MLVFSFAGRARSPSSALLPFLGRFPYYLKSTTEKGTLIPASLLEDLKGVPFKGQVGYVLFAPPPQIAPAFLSQGLPAGYTAAGLRRVR